MSELDPTQGDGAGHVTLSEATAAVLDELAGCRSELQSIRQRLNKAENPDGGGPEQEMTEEEKVTARDVARDVAARLEACAGALRNASDPSDPPFQEKESN